MTARMARRSRLLGSTKGRVCGAEGCSRPHHAHGLCQPCLYRKRKAERVATEAAAEDAAMARAHHADAARVAARQAVADAGMATVLWLCPHPSPHYDSYRVLPTARAREMWASAGAEPESSPEVLVDPSWFRE